MLRIAITNQNNHVTVLTTSVYSFHALLTAIKATNPKKINVITC